VLLEAQPAARVQLKHWPDSQDAFVVAVGKN
jgi:hypothetical protein